MKIIVFFIVSVALVGFWISAEDRGKKWLRVSLGVASISVAAVFGYMSSQTITNLGNVDHYEHMFLKASMLRLEKLLVAGDTATVAAAIGAYNAKLAESTNNFGHYGASLEMWNVLNETASTNRTQ